MSAKIDPSEWWLEECPVTHQAAEWAWRGFFETEKFWPAPHLSEGYFIYRDDVIYEFTRRDEKLNQFLDTVEKLKENKDYILERRDSWKKLIHTFLPFAKKLLEKAPTMSRRELAEEYREFTKKYLDHCRYTVFFECVDIFTEDVLPNILEKEFPKLSTKERFEIAQTMCLPAMLSFMEKERIDFLKSCLKVIDSPSEIKEQGKSLNEKHFWVKTHYGGSIEKTAKEFEEDISEHIQKGKEKIQKEAQQLESKKRSVLKKQENILKKYELNDDLLLQFDAIRQIGEAIDERKEVTVQFTYYLYHILDHIATRLNKEKELVSYTTYDELYEWLAAEKEVDDKTLKERRKLSVFLVKRVSEGKADFSFVTGSSAKELYDAFLPDLNVKEFSGTVASPVHDVITGEVSKVINTTTEEFKEGAILVTTMTRPDFLPLMRKAKAIITDEGGLTCHAAIVSRELGIPCIIGSKVATKVLDSGMTIKMDTNTGKVKVQ